MEFLIKLVEAIAAAAIPVLAGFLCELIHRAAVKLRDEAADEYVKTLIDEIEKSVTDAVAYVNQTLVDELKKSHVFAENPEYADEAFESAYEAVVKTLSDDAMEYIESAFGDIREYLTVKIEKEVRRAKEW